MGGYELEGRYVGHILRYTFYEKPFTRNLLRETFYEKLGARAAALHRSSNRLTVWPELEEALSGPQAAKASTFKIGR